MLHLGGAEFENERFERRVALAICKEFRLDHRIAEWMFELDGVLFEKSIVMLHNQNTVCVQYRLLRGEVARPAGAAVRVVSPARRVAAREAPGDAFMLDVRRGRHEIRS